MDNKDTPPLSRWLVTWLRDYTFWRDILSTMIGGVLVLVVAYLWAVSMGFLTSPGFWEAVGNFFSAVWWPMLLPLIGAFVSLFYTWRARKTGRDQNDNFSEELERMFEDEWRRRKGDEEA